LRTVSLKQEGNGNPGHGGYAVRMTYQINGGAKTVTVDAENSNETVPVSCSALPRLMA
jgi:hypothetical protein